MKARLILFRCVLWSVIILFVFSSAGCEALRRKFVRKSKKDDSTEEVIPVPKEYPPLPSDVAYDNHFTYFKYWTQELIDRATEGNAKKVKECYKQALFEINEMSRYLNEEKQKELAVYIKQMENIGGLISSGYLTDSQAYNIRSKSEILLLTVEKKFYTKEVKNWLRASKP